MARTGVPGSAIVILVATLNALPSIPAIGLVLVLSVDWFIGMARALGNCVATVVPGKAISTASRQGRCSTVPSWSM
jgi:Na+/H+-dicarboxylate symporter